MGRAATGLWASQEPGLNMVSAQVWPEEEGSIRRGPTVGQKTGSMCVCAKEEATGRSEDVLQLSHRDRIEGAWPRYWASWRKIEDTMNDVGGKRRAAEGQPGSIQTKEKLTRFAISEADGRVL